LTPDGGRSKAKKVGPPKTTTGRLIKKEHAVELEGEPWLPFVLSGVRKIRFQFFLSPAAAPCRRTFASGAFKLAAAGKPHRYRAALHLNHRLISARFTAIDILTPAGLR